MLRTLLNFLHIRKQTYSERHVIAVIVAGAVTAMILSLLIGLRQSVWFDEAYSILLAKQSVAQLIHLTAIDTHPPLYYLLLKAWANIFGWSELALRSLSVLALGGSVLVGGLLVKRLFGVRAALVTVAVMVLSPFLLRYGFEIRMYALGGLIGVAATYVLVLAQSASTTRRRWHLYSLYAALVALGMYTLYYTALLWVAHVVWLLWMSLRKGGSIKKLLQAPWWLAFAGSVILFAPWLPTFLKQAGNGALAPIAQSMTLENLLGIISFNTVYQPVWQLGPVKSLVVLFGLIAIGWLGVQAFRVTRREQRPYLVLLVLYLLVPTAILTIIGFYRPMYVERYLAHVAIGFSMFMGVAIAATSRYIRQPGRWLGWAFAGILCLGVAQLAQVGNFNFQRLQSPAINQAAATISCGDNSTVLAADPYVAIELNYYLDSCPVRFYSDARELRGGYAPLDSSSLQVRDPANELKNTETIYYVYYDAPQLEMPSRHKLTKRATYGPLTVDQFSAVPRG